MTSAAPPPVLVPPVARRPVVLTVVAAAVVFTALAVRLAGTSSALRVDRGVDAVLDPVGEAHFRIVEAGMALGAPTSVVPLAFLLAAVCLVLGRRRLAVLAVIGPGVTGVCTTLLKPALGRTIDGAFAFPSGHTGGATSLGLVAALLLISLLRPGRGGTLALLAGSALAVGGGVGAAMIASDSHYPTDTVGGFCTAVVVVLGAALALDRFAINQRRTPVREDPDPGTSHPFPPPSQG